MTGAGRVALFGSAVWADAWTAASGDASARRDVTVDGHVVVRLVGGRTEGLRVLRPAGGVLADYEELDLPPAGEAATLDALRALLAEGWDAVVLGHVPEGSPTLDWARAQPGVSVAPFGVSVATRLAGDWEAELAGLRKKLVADTRRCRRRLEEQHGEVRYERVRDPETAAATLAFIAERQRARRAELGDFSPFEREQVRGFFGELVERALDDPRLHLSRLTVGDQVAAAHLGWAQPDRFLYYMPTFAPDLARFAPGRLLLFELLRESVEADVELFDLGAGDEGYKHELPLERTELYSVVIGAPTLRGRLAAHWFGGLRTRAVERFAGPAAWLLRRGWLRGFGG
jgi:CelD/BcsL family acetyltransferase involved in cellulose biosynthesis